MMSSMTDDSIAPLDPSWSVNDVLLDRPAAVTVFNALGIDACCGGALSLSEAADQAEVSVAALLEALERLDAGERA
jgi:regulator of cell morphogenesis and NO signaling